MAKRPIYQYEPVSTTPDRAVGILLPMNKSGAKRIPSLNYNLNPLNGSSVFAQSYSTQEQVSSNIKSLLLTRKGGRLMHPTYGTNIQNILFENITDAITEELEFDIQSSFEKWLPYVNLNELEIFKRPDRQSFLIRLSFDVKTLGSNISINLFIDNDNIEINENDVEITNSISFSRTGQVISNAPITNFSIY